MSKSLTIVDDDGMPSVMVTVTSIQFGQNESEQEVVNALEQGLSDSDASIREFQHESKK